VRTSPRVAAALCVGALVLGACSSDGATPDDGASTTTAAPSPSSPTSPTAADTDAPSPSASPSDPFAMPDPVTEEYVDRVVNTIYEEWGAITKVALETSSNPTGVAPIETRERLTTLFAGAGLQNALDELDGVVRGDREQLLPPEEFEHVTWTTRKIFTANNQCMVVAGDFDTSGTAVEGKSLLSALSLQGPEDEATSNATGWKILDSLANTGRDGEVFDDAVMLEATLSDLQAFLELSCNGEAEGDT
jgi:hypothetical protein